MMFRRTAVVEPVSGAGSMSQDLVAPPLGPFSILGLSAGCGVASGLLEVATIVLRKHTFDPSRLYGMSRHFLWVIPITNLCLFLGLGVVLCLVASLRPRRGSWLAARLFWRAHAASWPAGCLSPDLWYRLAGHHARGRDQPGAALERAPPFRDGWLGSASRRPP